MEGVSDKNIKMSHCWLVIETIARYMLCCLLISLNLMGLAKGAEGDGQSAKSVKSLAEMQVLRAEMKQLEVFAFREKGLPDNLSKPEMPVETKRNIENRISSLGKKSIALTKTFQDLKAIEMQLEQRLAKRLVYLYKYARRGYMRALCTARDLDEFRRRAKYLAVIMAEDHRLLLKIFTHRYELGKKLEKVKDEMDRTDALLNREKRNLVVLKSDVDRNVIQLMRIHEGREF